MSEPTMVIRSLRNVKLPPLGGLVGVTCAEMEWWSHSLPLLGLAWHNMRRTGSYAGAQLMARDLIVLDLPPQFHAR